MATAKSTAVYNLDGNLLFELGIGPLSEIHLAHAARTQGAQHPIRSYAISHHIPSMRPDKGQLQSGRSCGGVQVACMKAGPLMATRRWIMPNEHKNPTPSPPPPGGAPPTGPGGARPDDGNAQPAESNTRTDWIA